jgi:hypothetical protein
VAEPRDRAAVELWVTRDGRRWHRYGETEELTRAFPVQLEEGRYGFTLVVRNGKVLSRDRPREGDRPEVWVEVDLTPPTLDVSSPEVKAGTDGAEVRIRWNAQDRNLAPTPMSVSYAAERGDTWTRVARGLDAQGSLVWRVPPGLGRHPRLRFEARDRAGNVATVDRSVGTPGGLPRPEGRILGVESNTGN